MKTLCILWGERGKGWVWHLGLNTNLFSVTQGELFVATMEESGFDGVLLDDLGCVNNLLHTARIWHCHSDLCNMRKRQQGKKCMCDQIAELK